MIGIKSESWFTKTLSEEIDAIAAEQLEATMLTIGPKVLMNDLVTGGATVGTIPSIEWMDGGLPPISPAQAVLNSISGKSAGLEELPPAAGAPPADIIIAAAGWKLSIGQLRGPARPPLLGDLEYVVTYLRDAGIETCDYADTADGPVASYCTDTIPSASLCPVYRVARLHTFDSFRNTWYVRRTTMPDPPKESPTPLVHSVEYHPEQAGMGKQCRRCLDRIAVYMDHAHGRWYCIKCYPRAFAEEIGRTAVEGMPCWYTYADRKKGWRWATLSEVLAFAEQWDFLLQPGEYSEVIGLSIVEEYPGLIPFLDGRMIIRPPSKDEISVEGMVRTGCSFTSSTVVVGKSGGLIGEFAVCCAVCGGGGALALHTAFDIKTGKRVSIGRLHAVCAQWFFESARAAHDIERQPCGHYFIGNFDEIADKEEYQCRDCGFLIRFKLTKNCPLCPVLCEVSDGRCWTCGKLALVSGRGCSAAGVVGSFDVGTALADFYILGALRESVPDDADIAVLYAARVGEIADQLRRYVIMATGGEMRHYTSSRHNCLMLGVDQHFTVTRKHKGTQWCSLCGFNLCTMKVPHKHFPVVEVRGAVNSKPVPPVRPSQDGLIPLELNSRLAWREWAHTKPAVIKGVRYDIYRVSQDLQTKFFDGSLNALSRSLMWSHYWKLYEKMGVELLEICRNIFLTGRWNNNFGGYWWGLAADLVWRYERGEISKELFIDHIFGYQHNGGSLLNKIYWLEEVTELLDLKRHCESAGDLLPWASKLVLQQYIRVARDYDDAGMKLCAAAIERTPRGYEMRNNIRYKAQLEEVINESQAPAQRGGVESVSQEVESDG